MLLHRASSGFTLVEIMITVGIIGLLAALVVPSFAQARLTARRNTCINNLRMISQAKDQAAIENNIAENAAPTAAEMSPFLKAGAVPSEPISNASSTYTVGAVSDNPVCANSGGTNLHALP